MQISPDIQGLGIFGDLHLSKRTWTKHQALTDDAYVSLFQIVNICKERKLGAVFVGDQFDSNYPSVALVVAWYQAVSELAKCKLPVFIIDGNHDPGSSEKNITIEENMFFEDGISDDPSWSCIHPWVQHIRPEKEYDVRNLKFSGFDFASTVKIPEQMQKLLALKDLDFVILHQYPKQYDKLSFDGVYDIDLDGYNLACDVFCGHIHHGGYETDLFSGHKLRLVGACNPRKTNEDHQKVFYIIDFNKSITQHNLYARSIFHYQIMVEDDLEFVINNIVKDINSVKLPTDSLYAPIRKPVIDISYNIEIPGIRSKLESLCEDKAHLFENPRVVNKNIQLIADLEESVDSVTLSGTIKSAVPDKFIASVMINLVSDPEATEVLLDEYIAKIEKNFNESITSGTAIC